MTSNRMTGPDTLVDVLREAAKLFREHPVYNSEGDGVLLTLNAALDDKAAARIEALEAENKRLRIRVHDLEGHGAKCGCVSCEEYRTALKPERMGNE